MYMDLIPATDQINQGFLRYKAERNSIPNDSKYKRLTLQGR